jgi:hypothetical protein
LAKILPVALPQGAVREITLFTKAVSRPAWGQANQITTGLAILPAGLATAPVRESEVVGEKQYWNHTGSMRVNFCRGVGRRLCCSRHFPGLTPKRFLNIRLKRLFD